MPNMDDFNVATALVLSKLYESFPQLVTFSIRELAPDLELDSYNNYYGTVIFLQREALIRYTYYSSVSGRFEETSLTLKGLAILNSVPESLKENTPLGQRLINATKTASAEGVKTIVGEIFSLGLSTVIKGVSGLA
jgi:hypothetical protein